jgi:phosphatidylinositol alpha-mannosyltransferase
VLVGPTIEEFQALLARSGASGSDELSGLKVLGRVSHEEKIEQMRRAEILCAPSLGGESFGIVLTEALAAGLPVVASDIPGYRAVLEEGSAGVLVPPGSADALGQALSAVLGDSELRSNLSLVGLHRAQRYSWDHVIDEVLQAYDDALYMGPCMVEEPAVPALTQMRHFLRRRPWNGKKPVETGGRAQV